MIVQFIRGRARDQAALVQARDRWERDLRPGAAGFLGSTSGFTPAGEVFVLARFESPDAAAANAARPEQGAWWQEFVAGLAGEPTVKETEAVDVLFDHGCDGAGFVQVMTGSGDEAVLRDLDRRFGALARDLRPDLLGGYRSYFADGSFADVGYFTSEADARAGEAQEMPDEVKELFAELGSAVADMEYHDLAALWVI